MKTQLQATFVLCLNSFLFKMLIKQGLPLGLFCKDFYNPSGDLETCMETTINIDFRVGV